QVVDAPLVIVRRVVRAQQLDILLVLQVGEGAGRRGEAASTDARVVDQCRRLGEVWRGPPNQGFRQDQVVLGRQYHRGVQRPWRRRALGIVAAPGQAVIADLSEGALVPRPAVR